MPSLIWLMALLLPFFVQSQTIPSNETVFGSGIPSDNNALLYYNALTHPIGDNFAPFPGFSLNASITSGISTNSSEIWSLIVDTDVVSVPTSNAGIVPTVNTAFAFYFGTETYGWSQGLTDWQLCAGIMYDDFPTSISGKKGNGSSADCAPYLGDACVTAWEQAYRLASAATTDGACPHMPSLNEIPACASQLDGAVLNTTSSDHPISNTTSTDLIYYSGNNSYVSISTGQTYTPANVSYRGLISGQYFAHQRVSFPPHSSNINASILNEARRLRLVGLSLVPTARAGNASNGVFEPNVRMLCARADTFPTSSAGVVVRAMPLLVAGVSFGLGMMML